MRVGQQVVALGVVGALALAGCTTDVAGPDVDGSSASAPGSSAPAGGPSSGGASEEPNGIEASDTASEPVVADPSRDRAAGPNEPGTTDAGRDSDTETDADPEATASPWQVAMLTIDDVPDGWERVGDGREGDDRRAQDEPSDGSGGGQADDGGAADGNRRGPDIRICNTTEFGAGVEFEAADDVAGAVFRAALFGPYATSIAATLPAGQVERLLTDLDRASRSCTTWVQRDEDGNEIVFVIETIDAGDLGDQTVAFGLRVTSGGISFEMDLVLWRLGDVGGAMIHAGTPGAVDRALSLDLAARVAERMVRIHATQVE